MASTVRTTCPYCGVGCGVLARVTPDSVEIAGDPEHPANRGRLCSKGHALAETLGPEGRLLYPQMFGRRTQWHETLNYISSELNRITAAFGPDAVAFYVSGQLLTEDYYVANKLLKGFVGTANIDTNSRLCMASAVVGHKRAFGEDVVPVGYEDLHLADVIVLVGSNAAWCHPVLFRRICEEKEQRPGLQIVVIDPRRTPTCDLADLHLPIRAGTDVWLFNGLLAHLHRHGAMAMDYVEAHTSDLQRALDAAYASAPDEQTVAKICGSDAARIGEFYRMFAASERVVTAFSQGVNQSSAGTDKINSIINCHLLTGRIGRPGMGPFSLTGQPNAMGGREVGGLATTLAAHLELENPAHRRIVQQFWGAPRVAERPGLRAVELFDAIHAGQVKAVWIMATNPVVSLPDANRVREALRKCELVIVSDCVASTDTTALAHVLLPAAAWGEKSGTVTNSERCISRQRSFLPAPGEARPDWWIISEVARRMGFDAAFPYTAAQEVFAEHAKLSGADNNGARAFDISALSGLTPAGYEELAPLQWPIFSESSERSRPFADGRFMHPDGKARFVATPPRAPVHAVNDDFPLVLNTGRVRDQWHTMTRTALAPQLLENQPEPFVDLHPQDALALAARNDELARVTTQWGSMVARVRTTGEMARGSVFVPIHWSDRFASEARVGALVSPAVDPLSGEPEFKHTPARVEPFPVRWYGFILTRGPLEVGEVTWWVRVGTHGLLRYEVAGRQLPADWSVWVRQLLGATAAAADYLDYEDAAAGVYRAAHLVDDRLEACMYVSSRADLPSRAPLRTLFDLEQLESSHRMSLLAGRPLADVEEPGAPVCSCFGVGRNTLRSAILRQGLTDVRQVGSQLRAGSSCGSCLPEIRALLKSLAVI